MSMNDVLPWAAILAICGMAAATQIMRLGGFWLMGHVPITPRVRRMLEALPGSVVTALVLPIIVKTGAAAFLAIAAVIVSMVLRRNEFLAVAVGVAVATLCRAYGL
jgi:uncharacterized membrane protein